MFPFYDNIFKNFLQQGREDEIGVGKKEIFPDLFQKNNACHFTEDLFHQPLKTDILLNIKLYKHILYYVPFNFFMTYNYLLKLLAL